MRSFRVFGRFTIYLVQGPKRSGTVDSGRAFKRLPAQGEESDERSRQGNDDPGVLRLNGGVVAVRDAVGSAVRDAVEEAVAAAVRAVLLNPDVRAALAAGATGQPPRPAGTVNYASAAAGRLRAAARAARSRAAARLHGWLRGLSRLAGAALRLRKPLSLAVGIGAVVGLGCYLAGPTVSAAVSGVAGFAASLAASALRAVKGTLARAASLHP
jgi:hypothetical protein